MKQDKKQTSKRLLAACMACVMAGSGANYGGVLSVYGKEEHQEADTEKNTVLLEQYPQAVQKMAADTSDLPDNDELFAQYVEKQMYPEREIALFGNYGESKLEGINRALYDELKQWIADIAQNGGSASLKKDFAFRWETSADGNALVEEVNKHWADLDITAVLDYMMVDCPYELYWYDKTQGFSFGGGSIEYAKEGNEAVLIWKGMQMKFGVASAYQGKDMYTVDGTKAKAVQKAIKNAKAIVAANAGKTDYEKMLAYKDKICELVEYNYDALEQNTPYGDPWQLIYVFDGDTTTNVVCEGYSKAFQYLCDLSDFSGNVTCYTVTGYMNGGTGAGAHMWNIVSIGGKNYLVDVTNSDGESRDNDLFLAGTKNGDWQKGYTFRAEKEGWEPQDIFFEYNPAKEDFDENGVMYPWVTDVKSMYGEGILKLADENYEPAAQKQENKITIAGEKLSKEYNGSVFVISTQKGTHLTWKGEKPVRIEGYYLDEGVTKTTAENSGASSVGAAPADAGVYYVKAVVDESEEYMGTSAYIPFTISAAEINAARMTMTPYSGTYDRMAHEMVKVSAAGSYLADKKVEYRAGTDGAWSQTAPTIKDAGNRSVYVRVSGKNYKEWISKALTAKVNPKALTADMMSDLAETVYYTGNAVTPALNMWFDAAHNVKLVQGTDYTVSYKNNKNVHHAEGNDAPTVELVGIGNYKGTLSRTFAIVPYDGEVSTKFNGKKLSDGWYTEDVAVTADGFTVSDSLTGSFQEKYIVSGEGTKDVTLYFKQKGSGYITDAKKYTVRLDKTAPVFRGEESGIRIKNVWYRDLLNKISFGRFFNDASVDVTIAAEEKGSGIESYFYYLDKSGKADGLSAEELASKNFQKTTGDFRISGEEKYVVYAYAQDKAGNQSSYICSEGFVIDRTAPKVVVKTPAKDEIFDTSAVVKAQMNESGTITYVVKDTKNDNMTAQAVLADAGRKTVTVSEPSKAVTCQITGLQPFTNYFIYAVGTDSAGNIGTVAENSFQTGQTQMSAENVKFAVNGTYGVKLSELPIKAEGVVTTSLGAEVKGTWAFAATQDVDGTVVNSSEIFPNVNGQGYEAVFTPDENAEMYGNTLKKIIVPDIAPRSLTAEGVVVGEVTESFTYDGTEKKPILSVTDSKAALRAEDYEVSYESNVNAGKAKAVVSGKNNYTGTVEREFVIAKADSEILIADGKDSYTKTFGDEEFALDGIRHTGDGTLRFQVTEGNDVAEMSGSTVRILKAGTAVITVSMAQTANCNAAESRTIAIAVKKKPASVIDVIRKNYVGAVGTDGKAERVNIAGLLPTDRGNTSYVVESSEDSCLSGVSLDENAVLSYQVGAGAAGSRAEITVTASSDNYEDMKVTVEILLTDKFPVAEKSDAKVAVKGSNELTYGEKLGKLELNQAVFVKKDTDEVVKGTLSWTYPDAIPAAGTTVAEWKFVPDNANQYEELTGTLAIVVKNASQKAPAGLKGTDETIDGKKDGKIGNLTTEMEYSTDGKKYTKVTDTVMEHLAAGTYFVRYAAKENYDASPAAEIKIAAGRKLKVELPKEQIGYTVKADKTELSYNETMTLHFELAKGYSRLEDFAVKVDGSVVELDSHGTAVIRGILSDKKVTVEGVADKTAPTAEMTIGENHWNELMNKITFGTYFKDTQSVEITAEDFGSGVSRISYYLSEKALTETEVQTLADSAWSVYTGKFTLNPDRKCVVYVKAADKDGNLVYISSDGLVLDASDAKIAISFDGKEYADGTADKYMDGVQVSVTAEDELSGVANASYSLNNGESVKMDKDTAVFDVTERGSHIVVVTANDYAGNSVQKTAEFHIYKVPTVTWTAKEDVVYDGKELAPEEDFTLDLGGSEGKVTYFYRDSKADDSAAFTKGLPKEVGSYTVKAEVEADDSNCWAAASQTAEIAIVQAETPENMPDKETPIVTVPNAETLADVVLPNGWSWADETVKVVAGGYVTAKALYYDAHNYKQTEVEIQIAGSVEIVEDGTDKEYVTGGNGNAVITCNGASAEFVSVEVDGKQIDSSCYTLEDAEHTVLTFDKAYLHTLPVGTHTIKLNYTASSAEMELAIKKQEVQSGEDGNGNGSGSGSGNGNASGNGSGNENGNASAAGTGTDSAKKPQTSTTQTSAQAKTGDHAMPFVWGVLLLASCLGAGVAAVVRRRRK